jgi:molybdopterin molybdotransferase
MVKLSDDCFAHDGELMTVAEAFERIETRLAPVVEAENVPVRAAVGRVLAQDVVARMNLPPHANSAVDGYAVVHSDLFPDRETVLSVGGRAAAGQLLGRQLRRGEAIRIFTGAPMPEGADTVIMQEDCVAIEGSDGEQVRIRPGARKGANHRRAGEDVSAGAFALRAGRRLLPADLGVAAALGCDWLPVFRRLHVALLSTGNEVCEPGRPLRPGAIYDANRVMLIALLEGLGCVVSDLGIQPDRAPVLADTLAGATIGHDLIVTSGGVSTGEEDHVRNAIEQLGNLHFWLLAIKPGKPVALGQIGTVPLIGLPGNPVAAFVTFVTIAKPLILKLAGAAPTPPKLFPVRAGFGHRKKPGRREYLRASLERGGSGLVAMKYPHDGSAILSSIVRSDGLAVLDEDAGDLAAGSVIDFMPLTEALA